MENLAKNELHNIIMFLKMIFIRCLHLMNLH